MNAGAEIEIPTPQTGRPEISMAPLVDVVFLLLIFFMVTTVFPDEDGLMIEKPVSESGAPLDADHIVVKLGREGQLEYNGKPVSAETLGALLEADLEARSLGSVIVHADRRATTESLIRVIDISKASGATQLGIATDEEPGQP